MHLFDKQIFPEVQSALVEQLRQVSPELEEELEEEPPEEIGQHQVLHPLKVQLPVLMVDGVVFGGQLLQPEPEEEEVLVEVLDVEVVVPLEEEVVEPEVEQT